MALTFQQYMELGKLVADAAGGLGEGAAKGRVEEGQLGVQQGQLALNAQELALLGYRYANDANMQRYLGGLQGGQLELQQRQFQLDAPTARMRQVMQGDLLANAQDVHLEMPSDVPEFNFTGGLRPSALGPNSKAFGRELSRQALLNQMPGGPATTTTAAPQMTTPRTAPHGGSYEGSIQQVIDQRRGTGVSAQATATADPEAVSGGASPLVSTGRVVPRGDVFAPVAPPPPVVGFGGPLGGESAGGPGETAVGPLRGGEARREARLGRSSGGRQYRDLEREGRGPSLGPSSTLVPAGPSDNTAGYAAAPGGPNPLAPIGVAESLPGQSSRWRNASGALSLFGPWGTLGALGIGYLTRPRDRNLPEVAPYYGSAMEEPVTGAFSDPNFLTPRMGNRQDPWGTGQSSWDQPGWPDRPRERPETPQGFVWNIPQF